MSAIPYRIEISPNNRATCQDKDCKAERIKLTKGEIRFGVWVEIPNAGASFRWKHWGCVTPLQISHWAEKTEGEPSLIDGWEDLDGNVQDKVQRAMQQGHVDDDDWRHNVAENRIDGAKRPRKSKKAQADADADADAEDEPAAAEEGPSPEKPKRKKRTKAEQEAADDAADDAPAPPKKKRGSAKSNEKIKSEDADQEPPVKGKKPKVKKEDEEPTPAVVNKKKRSRSQQTADVGGLDGNADSSPVDDAAVKTKSKRKRATSPEPAKGKTTVDTSKPGARSKKAKVQDDKVVHDAPVTKAGRKKKGNDSEEIAAEEPSTKRVRKKKDSEAPAETHVAPPKSRRGRSQKAE